MCADQPGRHRHRSTTRLRRSAAAAAMSLSLVAPTAQASTAVSIGATGSWTNRPVTALQQWPYAHVFANDPVIDTKVVKYPASLGFIGMSMGQSVASGTVGLSQLVESTPGKKILVCESQGCLSVTRLLQKYAADPTTAPPADDLIIVMVGNPATAGGGISAQRSGKYEPFFRITFPGATPESHYETFNVTREYDFFADQPLDTLNGFAVLNSVSAFFVIHPHYGGVDMSDPNNLVKVSGNTTYVLIPTKRLPLLMPFYGAAESWKNLTGRAGLLTQVETLDTRLRAIIGSAYDREGYVTQSSLPPAGFEVSESSMGENAVDAAAGAGTPEPELDTSAQDSSGGDSSAMRRSTAEPLAIGDGAPTEGAQIATFLVTDDEPPTTAPVAEPMTAGELDSEDAEIDDRSGDKEDTSLQTDSKPGVSVVGSTVRSHRAIDPTTSSNHDAAPSTNTSSSTSDSGTGTESSRSDE